MTETTQWDKNSSREEILSIIRLLQKAERLSIASTDTEQRAYILYFLAYMYFKYGDIVTAKEKLKKCIRLNSKIKKPAVYLLSYIWDYKMRPNIWRWWLFSPQHTWFRRIFFICLSTLILASLILHPCVKELLANACNFIGVCSYSIEFNWTTYLILISLFILVLFIPIIHRLKVHDVEIELNTLPLYEPLLSYSYLQGENQVTDTVSSKDAMIKAFVTFVFRRKET